MLIIVNVKILKCYNGAFFTIGFSNYAADLVSSSCWTKRAYLCSAPESLCWWLETAEAPRLLIIRKKIKPMKHTDSMNAEKKKKWMIDLKKSDAL